MKWITRQKVEVDRAACPRLIRKFISRYGEVIVSDAFYAEGKRRVPAAAIW
jgi:hypothetical protein